ALQTARDAGWVPVVVTNGPYEQQENRIRRSGVHRYIADWVISEEGGVSKPNPRIFAMAAQRVRMRLRDAWVVGDSPEADIGGAAALGLPSVWVHRGRTWMDSRFAPTRTAAGRHPAAAPRAARVGPPGRPRPVRPRGSSRPWRRCSAADRPVIRWRVARLPWTLADT